MAKAGNPSIQRLVHGVDNRVPIEHVEAAPWRAFCCLEVNFGDQPATAGYGTGLLIAPNIILTAAHNLYSLRQGVWAKKILALVGMKKGAHAAQAGVKRVEVAPGYRNSLPRDSFQHDYGIAVVESDALYAWAGEFVRVTDQAPMDNAELASSNVSVAGYPDEDRPQITLKSAFGAIIPSKLTKTNIHYEMDTMPGQSGCPVFKWSAQSKSFRLAGVHVAGYERSNAARRYDGEMREQVKAWVAEHGKAG